MQHTIEQGECLFGIASRLGMDWRAIWEHENNRALRDERSDPNVLNPGDELFVPELDGKQVGCESGQRHRFRRVGLPYRVRLRILRDGEPRVGVHWVLTIDGSRQEGDTDEDGFLEATTQRPVDNAELQLVEGDDEEHYQIGLAHLDPVQEVSGAQQRLRNLGYACDASGELDETTEAAIAAFRSARGLDEAGGLDDEVRDALREAHGS